MFTSPTSPVVSHSPDQLVNSKRQASERSPPPPSTAQPLKISCNPSFANMATDAMPGWFKSLTYSPLAAGHDLISLSYDLPSLATDPKTILTRNIKSLDIDAFTAELRTQINLTWPAEPHPIDRILACQQQLDNAPHSIFSNQPDRVSNLASSITQATIKTFDNLAPLQTITVGSRFKPWVSRDICELARKKASAIHHSRSIKKLSDRLYHNKLCSKVRNKIDSAKYKYLSDVLNASPDPQTTWRKLTAMGAKARPKPSPLKYFSP